MEPSNNVGTQDGTFHWLLIRSDVIPHGRQRTYEEQRPLVQTKEQNRQNLQDLAERVQASRETSAEKNTDDTGTDMWAVD